MTNKAPDKHQIVLLSMVVAGVIMAGIGLVSAKQSNIIAAIGLFVAAFVYWRKNTPTS